MRSVRLLVLVAALVLTLAPLARAQEPVPDFDRWFIVKLAGVPSGWMNISQKTERERVTTASRMTLHLGRGETQVSVGIDGSFVETLRGEPISMRTEQRMGQKPITSEWTWTTRDGKTVIEGTTSQDLRDTRSTREPPPGKWLTPAAAASFIRARLAAGAKEISVRAIEPASGLDPIAVERAEIEPVTIEVMGKPASVFKAKTTTSASPSLASTEYLDPSGIPVKYTAKLGTIELEFEAADRAAAEAAGANGARLPEVMAATFVRPSRAVKNPRDVTRAVYVLSVDEGELPPILSTPVQQVEKLDARRARVTIDLAKRRPVDDAKPLPEYLAATSMVNSDDSSIRMITAAAVRKAGDVAADRARAITRFATEFVDKKALDTGFASASETVRSRTGDCTEHAVLVAAMLRSVGIPSRTVSGLVYADQFAGSDDIFAYHMWAQALVEIDGSPTWLDVDAALGQYEEARAGTDATHIAIAASSMPDGESFSAMTSIVPLLGRLKIEVESFQ